MFNGDMSLHEAGVAEGVHKVSDMYALGMAEDVCLAA
jgi:hypothetical protein